MGAFPKPNYMTPEEYLLGENDRTDGTRYEYVNGKVYAMAGASRNHNRVAMRFSTRLDLHLENGPCEVFQADMKIGIRSRHDDIFYYPDVQVTCEEENEKYYNTSPCLIVEVLSDSTARIDRTEKLAAYQQLPSLQEYVLCSQDSPHIEVYRKRMEWKPEYYGTGQTFMLDSVGLEIMVDDLYGFLLK